MELKHRFCFTNGIRMHYVEQGEGPLVVLLHGWPESWYSWRHQIEALAKAGYRVVAPDQRGYGDTEAPGEVAQYSIVELVGDVVGLVNALGETEATLIGHDWGSMVTANAALLRPDLFTRIGLLSVPFMLRKTQRPAVRFSLASQKQHFYQAYFQEDGRVERELAENPRRSVLGVLYSGSGEGRSDPRNTGFIAFDKSTRFVDNLVVPTVLPNWLTEDDLAVFAGQFERSGFRGGINWYRNMDRNWALTPFLDGARPLQPLIFIAGTLDGVIQMTADDVAALEQTVPNLAGKHLIEGAGHWIQQERPEQVNELLLAFLGETSV